MKVYFLILYISMALGFGFCQQLSPSDSISLNFKGKITDFGVDNFNSIYYLLNSTELNKLDFKTGKKFNFSNHTILEDLNTQNVLQISLKSGFFNLLLLDNQLNLLQDPIFLVEDSNFSPILTALVDNNYLWGYDPVLQRLILWNYREKTIYKQSVILSDKSAEEYFSELVYDKGKIYLVGGGKILKFDNFANLIKVYSFETNFEQIQIVDKYAYYSKKGELFRMNLENETIEKMKITTNFDYFSTNTSHLFVLKDKLVYIYPLQK